jgi:MFS family permease
VSSSQRVSILLLPIIYLGYMSLGLPDGTFGVAWPKMHLDLQSPIGLAGVLVIIGTTISAISGFSSGRIVGRFKTGPVVFVSCLLTGSGLLIMSRAPSFAWVLFAILPLGLGAGAVDAGLNGFVARHYSGRHMNWLHACWGIGATVGPLIMAYALSSAGGWRNGFLAISLAQLTLAALFLVSLNLWKTVPERAASTHATADASALAPTTQANSAAGWLSALIFAMYVAVEGTTGVWAGSILVVGRGFAPATAGLCATAFYGSITTGRILVGFIVDRFGNRRLIAAGCVLAFAGAVLFVFARSVPLAAIALVLLGLGFSPVYPCLMHEVPKRFAPESVQVVIGRQSGAANLGAGLIPSAAGLLAQTSIESITWVVAAGIVLLAATIRRLNQLT